MKKHAYFHKYRGDGWPSLDYLEPYFTQPPPQEGWFPNSGNDSGGLDLIGVEGTEHLPRFHGRKDIVLSMWGNPEHGVLMIYERQGGPEQHIAFASKGDMSRIKDWVRTLHDDPMPIGLYIPFAKAWEAVKEFMATEGQLPTSIEWIDMSTLPEGTFPDP